ncbi:hypothetical protein Tco_0610765 [Tanacetum coccineum]
MMKCNLMLYHCLQTPVIAKYKLLKEGIMVHYQLIRADGSSKRYSSMIRMLQDIDREDLETLWKFMSNKALVIFRLFSSTDQLLRDLEKSSLMGLGYKTGLESVEEKLEFYKKNESVYVEKINRLKYDIQVGVITIRELRKKLEKIQKEKYIIQFNVDKFENASKSLDKLIECQIVDNCKKNLGYEKYNAVPPPYTGNFMPPLSFTGLDEFVNEPVVENSKAMSSEEEPKVRKNNDAPIIKEWVSDSEEENMSQTKTEKKTVKPSIAKIELPKLATRENCKEKR